MVTVSTVPAVMEQIEKVMHAHRSAHHGTVRRAREARAIAAAVAAGQSPQSVQVPDLEPTGMPSPPTGIDPLDGL